MDPTTPPIPQEPSRTKDSRLSEDDWIGAAMAILVNDSVSGIRIDALCKRLGVTKGSFYWHFRGRTHLLDAVLASWQQRMTLNVIDRLNRMDGPPLARLRALLMLPRQENSPPFARIERSIRGWARSDDRAEAAIRHVDGVRMHHHEELLIAHGLSREVAKSRAYMCYAIITGDSMLVQSLDMDPENWVDEMLAHITRPE